MTRPDGKTGPIAAAVMFDALVHSVDDTHAGDLWYLSLPDCYRSDLASAFRTDRHCNAACSDRMDASRMEWAMKDNQSPRSRAEIEIVITEHWLSPSERMELAAAELRRQQEASDRFRAGLAARAALVGATP